MRSNLQRPKKEFSICELHYFCLSMLPITTKSPSRAKPVFFPAFFLRSILLARRWGEGARHPKWEANVKNPPTFGRA